ncbi:hypothetical protein FB559_2579 [Actinoallomurus bryophytorum]|uniref:Macro domain-containing protein n=1 Tax=Actinoallomurus bryophytorum TaxID=1490222 RepID=A0A543CIT3_9ACTN|nr:hypothetical protein FB559_2579 [Actinoallomurus bryophytorum]
MLIFCSASMALICGLTLRYLTPSWRGGGQAARWLVEWLLFALFPVLLIFSLFPESATGGQLFGFKFTGAFAAFVFVWWYGVRSSRIAARVDRQEAQTASLVAELEALRWAADRLVLPYSKSAWSARYQISTRFCLVTGSIETLKAYDVWLASENTALELSRFNDASISSAIRFRAALRDQDGAVICDQIADELRKQVPEFGAVEPGRVLVTRPFGLSRRNNVKRVLVVAAVEGMPGVGYRQVQDIRACVRNALDIVDQLNARGEALRSLVLPLLGSGSGCGDPATTAEHIVDALVTHLLAPGHSCGLSEVAVIARYGVERDAVQSALDERIELAKSEKPGRA